MRVLIDTHVWVFHSAGMDDQLSASALSILSQAQVLCVSAISCWEIALLVKKGRLGIHNVSQWIQDALLFPKIELLPLTPEILVHSVHLKELHHDPADRMIVATGEVEHTPLVTADTRIQEWGGIETIW